MKTKLMILVCLFFSSCTHSDKKENLLVVNQAPKGLSSSKQFFGTTESGDSVDLFTLTNSKGIEVQIMNLGGIVVSIKAPDKSGQTDDIVLGLNDLNGYLKGHPSFGAIVGRYANRIAKGTFTLGKKTFHLAKNNGNNHLHGGVKGFSQVLWKAEEKVTEDAAVLQLSYLSKDQEEGYPGNLQVHVIYSLKENNELQIEYSAVSDKDTVVNLTHHSYFNLSGQDQGSVLDHIVQIDADHYTPTDDSLIPTGSIKEVRGTPLDFRTPRRVGDQIAKVTPKKAQGYDHNFVLKNSGPDLHRAARIMDPNSHRTLEVFTTEPGLQFYTGNWLEGQAGKNGKFYKKHSGLCLETQHFPDSPNHPNFPTTRVKAGQVYQTKTIYRFGIVDSN